MGTDVLGQVNTDAGLGHRPRSEIRELREGRSSAASSSATWPMS